MEKDVYILEETAWIKPTEQYHQAEEAWENSTTW